MCVVGENIGQRRTVALCGCREHWSLEDSSCVCGWREHWSEEDCSCVWLERTLARGGLWLCVVGENIGQWRTVDLCGWREIGQRRTVALCGCREHWSVEDYSCVWL